MNEYGKFGYGAPAAKPVWDMPRPGEAPKSLIAVLDVYRGWYAEGSPDSIISMKIRTKFIPISAARPFYKKQPFKKIVYGNDF